MQAGTPLAPVTEYVALAPAVDWDVPATVIEYMSSAPVFGYFEPAPAVSLSVPSQQLPFVYTTTTVTDDLEEFAGPVYDQVHQEQFAAGEMTENIVEIPLCAGTGDLSVNSRGC